MMQDKPTITEMLAAVDPQGSADENYENLKTQFDFISKELAGGLTIFSKWTHKDSINELHGPEFLKSLISKLFGEGNEDHRKSYPEYRRRIFVRGPRGTGKENLCNMLAEVLAKISGCSSEFRTINAAGLSDNLLESTLFGHTAGAFTGAGKSRDGCLGKIGLSGDKLGCIFIDEIGQMGKDVQAKMLRVLSSGKFAKLGEEEESEKEVFFHLICATNKSSDVETEELLQDFADRVRQTVIELPPVSDRLLSLKKASTETPKVMPTKYFTHLVNRAQEELRWRSKEGDSQERVKKIVEFLVQNAMFENYYKWPGNLREIVAVVKEWLWTGEQPHLLESASANGADAPAISLGDATFDERVASFEKELIRKHQSKTRSNEECAKLLGMTRNRLEKRLKKLGLESTSVARIENG
jgi:two-component system, NtrC family, response regulator AtoC